MANSRDTRDWYQKKRWIFLWLIFFPPLGLILLWLKRWPVWAKITGTSMSIILLLIALGSTPPEQAQVSTPSTTPESVSSPQAFETNPPAPAPEPTPETFQNALNHATEAVNLGQNATTAEDWEAAANQWKSAVESLEQVPEDSSYFQTTQTKLAEYSSNLEYAQQQADRIRQEALAAEQQRQQQQAATSAPQPDSPIRASVSGSCDCPYDRDSSGRRCGRRSAYSRPGGRSPICYVGD